MTPCVFQDWMLRLTMQQQSVLVLACRGPDGVGKFHPTKQVVARYRATVLKAAYLGRPMKIDEGDDTTFMTLIRFSDDAFWGALVRAFFDNVDELPHHYYMHLMHGAQIAGYKHGNPLMRTRWRDFYLLCCRDLHLYPEDEVQMDERLGDWGHKFWDSETLVSARHRIAHIHHTSEGNAQNVYPNEATGLHASGLRCMDHPQRRSDLHVVRPCLRSAT